MFRIILTVAALAMTTTAVQAQAFKVGVVNSEMIVQSYPQFKQIEKQLQRESEGWKKERTVWEADMERLQKFITDKEQALAAGQTTFSEKRKTELRAEIDSLTVDFRERINRQVTMEQERFQQRRQELIAEVLEVVNETIEELGKQKGYDFIIDTANGTIVYAKDPTDLTGDLMQMLKNK